MVVKNQFITAGMGGQIIDISIPAVIDTIKLYPEPISDPWTCLKKIRSTFHETVVKRQVEANKK